jgi:hypothetical protein
MKNRLHTSLYSLTVWVAFQLARVIRSNKGEHRFQGHSGYDAESARLIDAERGEEETVSRVT